MGKALPLTRFGHSLNTCHQPARQRPATRGKNHGRRRTHTGFFDAFDSRRRQARPHHRRARDADLSDDVVRVRRRRPRGLAVRAAGFRQYLYPHRQSDLRRVGRARRRARGRHSRLGDCLRPRRASGRDARADDAGRRICCLQEALWRLDQPVQPFLQEFRLERGVGRSRRHLQFRKGDHAEDQGDLHRILSPIRAASSPTSKRSPKSRARPRCR